MKRKREGAAAPPPRRGRHKKSRIQHPKLLKEDMKRYNEYKVLSASRKDYIIYMSDELLAKIQKVVSLAPSEAQWFHFVTRRETEKLVIYEMEEILIPYQECSGAEVESLGKQMTALAEEIIETYGDDKFDKLYNSMTAWCHSHVEMSPSPSDTDRKTFEAFKDGFGENPQAQDQPIIMMIFNKRNEYFNRVWDPVDNVLHENILIYHKPRYDHEDLEKMVKERMKPKEYPPAGKTQPPPVSTSTTSTVSGKGGGSEETSLVRGALSSFLHRNRSANITLCKAFDDIEKMNLKEAQEDKEWLPALKKTLETSTLSLKQRVMALYLFLLTCTYGMKDEDADLEYIKRIVKNLTSNTITYKTEDLSSVEDIILDELAYLIVDADVIKAAYGKAATLYYLRDSDLTELISSFRLIAKNETQYGTTIDTTVISNLQILLP